MRARLALVKRAIGSSGRLVRMGQQNTRELLGNFRPWLEILLNNLALLCTLLQLLPQACCTPGFSKCKIRMTKLFIVTWYPICWKRSVAIGINNLPLYSVDSLCSFVSLHCRRKLLRNRKNPAQLWQRCTYKNFMTQWMLFICMTFSDISIYLS